MQAGRQTDRHIYTYAQTMAIKCVFCCNFFDLRSLTNKKVNCRTELRQHFFLRPASIKRNANKNFQMSTLRSNWQLSLFTALNARFIILNKPKIMQQSASKKRLGLKNLFISLKKQSYKKAKEASK